MLLRITPSEAPNAKTQGQQSEPAPNRITRARKAASAQLICQMVDYSDDISYRSRCHVFSRTSVNRSCTSYRIAATAQDTAKRPLSNTAGVVLSHCTRWGCRYVATHPMRSDTSMPVVRIAASAIASVLVCRRFADIVGTDTCRRYHSGNCFASQCLKCEMRSGSPLTV